MKFSVVIPTRGDVDLTPIIASYDGIADEVLVWDNSKRENLAVYARYAMIAEARNELIMTQDDDVIVSDPWAIVESWRHEGRIYQYDPEPYIFNHVVCNMPEAHRSQPFYTEHALVGYGAVFHRDAPLRAFHRFGVFPQQPEVNPYKGEMFLRRCDVVFTALTPRILVDVPIRNLPYYDAPNRSWKQPGHFRERKKMLELALEVRDNG